MDALRLLFASIVVFAHAYDLSLSRALLWFRPYADTVLAVRGFFVISGYLVFLSYERSATPGEYLLKRARRIYPAYASVVVGCALLGACVSALPASQYFGRELLAYLASNLLFLNFLHPTLPGVFAGNPLAAVDGSLWTIKIEVAFYLGVPLIVWAMRRLGRLPTLGAIFLCSLAYSWLCTLLARTSGQAIWLLLGKQLPAQMVYFVSGALCYYYHDFIARHLRVVAPLGLACLAIGWTWGVQALYAPGLASAVFLLAFGTAPVHFARFGDLSYGLYIWHFPIIQALIAAGLFAASPYTGLLAAWGAALLAATLSWHLVEKPWLARGSHYVVASRFLAPS